MEKKKFKITLKSGLHSEFEAETLERLQEKIRIGLYHILPLRGNDATPVTEETVSSIEEIKEN